MTDFGKYELFEEVGRGSFGAVYRARDRVLNRPVAIKFLHPPLAADSYFIENFKREASNVAGLDHHNIVVIHETGEINGRYYQAMRWYPGGNLADRLKLGSPLMEDALRIIAQICAGIQAVHAAGWVHRDLKPANILFDTSGTAVVSDFGLARALQGSLSASTHTGLAGTPFYRAPELWRDQSAEPASDVYSLGCILAEMLTGHSPFQAQTPDGVLARHLFDGPDFGPVWPPPGVSGKLAGVVQKALSREVAGRYQNAAEFALALDQALLPAPADVQQLNQEKRPNAFLKTNWKHLKPYVWAVFLLIFVGFLFVFATLSYIDNQVQAKFGSIQTTIQAALVPPKTSEIPQKTEASNVTSVLPTATLQPTLTAARVDSRPSPTLSISVLPTITPALAPLSATATPESACANFAGKWDGILSGWNLNTGISMNFTQTNCEVQGNAIYMGPTSFNSPQTLQSPAIKGTIKGDTLQIESFTLYFSSDVGDCIAYFPLSLSIKENLMVGSATSSCRDRTQTMNLSMNFVMNR